MCRGYINTLYNNQEKMKKDKRATFTNFYDPKFSEKYVIPCG